MSPSDGHAIPAATRQADQKYCFSCGKLLHVTAGTCPSCGAHQAGELMVAQSGLASRPVAAGLSADQSMFCFGCGAQIHRAAYACPACGAVQQRLRVRGPGKDRTVAIVLAFLLGGVGAHRFYLGSIGLGLLYLLFCWTFVPAVAAMVEGIIFLSTTDDEFHRRYG